jgi:hypothetical protein
VSWSVLRREYQRERIGRSILAEVERAVDLATRRYDPVVYGGGAPTWAQARDDLIQEVVATVLLAEGQIDYLMQVSNTLDDFRALLFRQTRRLLARRRQRTVIDNLVERSREIVTRPPFDTVGRAPPTFRLAGRTCEERQPTDDERRLAASRITAIPRIPFNVTERAPIVYAAGALDKVVKGIADALPTSFTISDVDAILKIVLTDWIPSFLEEGEESVVVEDRELGPEAMVVVTSTVDRVLDAMSEEQSLIFLRKLEGVSDSEVAKELGLSRPTLAARKEGVWRLMEHELSDLPEEHQRAVTGELGLRLVGGATNE